MKMVQQIKSFCAGMPDVGGSVQVIVGLLTYYATFDGAVTGGTLSGGNLTSTHTSGNGTTRSLAQKNSGKWYFEITAGTGIAAGGTNSSAGVMKLGATDNNILNGSDGGMVLQGAGGIIFSNNTSSGFSIG